MQCKPFKPVMHQQLKKKLELVHSDVCKPLQVESIGALQKFWGDITPKMGAVHPTSQSLQWSEAPKE